MNPQENVKEQLELAKEIQEGFYPPSAKRLAELVLALNEWMEKGEAVPECWMGPLQN